MGLFGWLGSTPDNKRNEDIRTGTVAPDRSERRKCWEARDGFNACLDRHDVVDCQQGEGKEIAEKKCAIEHRRFEQDCVTAWVTYFKKFRVADHQKKKMIERLEKEGANQMSMSTEFKS